MQASQEFNKSKILILASRSQRKRAGIVLIVLAALFGLFELMALGVIDSDRLLDPCGFKQRHGLPCPTCGMTHSVFAFARGEVLESFYIQPAAALICCFMIIAAVLALLTVVFGIYFSFLNSLFSEIKVKYVILMLIVVLAAGWVVTLARALAANAGS
jgi:small-conductance mechanosensitive channel